MPNERDPTAPLLPKPEHPEVWRARLWLPWRAGSPTRHRIPPVWLLGVGKLSLAPPETAGTIPQPRTGGKDT